MGYRNLVRFSLTFSAAVGFWSLTEALVAQVHVKGFYRKDGTYVRSHYRSDPDGKYVRSYTPEHATSPWTEIRDLSSPVYRLESPVPSLDERIRDVATISYHGIGFTTTHPDFLRIFPQAQPVASVDSDPVVSYAIDDVDGERDAVWFQFIGEDFLCLGYTYDAELVQRYGGASTLLSHARQRFGPPTAEDEDVTVWTFPTIDRSIRAGWHGEQWCLLITRDSLQKRARTSGLKSRPEASDSEKHSAMKHPSEAGGVLSDAGRHGSHGAPYQDE